MKKSRLVGCVEAVSTTNRTANKKRKEDGPPSGSPGGVGDSSDHDSNGGSRRDAAAGSATVDQTPAEAEEETIRLKSLSDLNFPSPPQNAAQAPGFINQVLMAIDKVQPSERPRSTFGHKSA